ncbi:carbon-nitrogen hydrolase family protein [Paraglaciecola aquimarina]|uniref:Carbon-nitrogen hydrolase family protein n=1 Tax=Paraglaciecola algarum TaxID=3050085 RepID=A0ABS9D346_9ALTE|nr:carbon-nitrogen hydrolase family protein [Paraglaciecola sp. G1-23]MCF2947353.1 carbon-nitrogen hydrolase family protein [Paraglaciecola sp. G1-23]
MANIVAIQMTSTPDVTENLQFVEQELQKLPPQRPCLVVLPECFACFGGNEYTILQVAEDKNSGPVQNRIAELAKQYDVWIVAGSFPILCDIPDKYTASCLLFNNQGAALEEYQKIHLFDVQISDNTGTYLESSYTQAGNKLVVVDTPFGNLGLAVCYDIRFAAMFTAMSQIAPLDVLALPAAFTQKTGQAHWQHLLNARAIENQCYLVAANQTGKHVNQRQTYGHSCIISPWGQTLAELPQETGTICTQIDHALISKIRANMPVHQHNKFRSQLV